MFGSINKNSKAYIMLVLATLFWAGNFTVGKFAFIENVPPYSLSFLRWLLVWLILYPFTYKEIIKLNKFARRGVFLKGGHSQNPGIDYYSDGERTWQLETPELKIKSSHGTGCRISSGLCAGLASGKNPLEAAVSTKNYVFHSLRSCKAIDNNKWLMASPGNLVSLENKVKLKELK